MINNALRSYTIKLSLRNQILSLSIVFKKKCLNITKVKVLRLFSGKRRKIVLFCQHLFKISYINYNIRQQMIEKTNEHNKLTNNEYTYTVTKAK